MNLPSPCEIGTFTMSPTLFRVSQGERSEQTRVLTILDWWRAMVLYVRVGAFSSASTMSPTVTRPSLMSAWKPLQMPAIRPSRRLSRSRTASVTLAPRKKEVMNLPLPSGSSPPEKPPGMKTISASRTFLANSSADSATAAGVRLLMTKISASMPARLAAFAVSYSQLVPGNTGMSILGEANFLPLFAAAPPV